MFVPVFVETMWQLYTILSTETNNIIAEVTPIAIGVTCGMVSFSLLIEMK